jgi:hypothetical protein
MGRRVVAPIEVLLTAFATREMTTGEELAQTLALVREALLDPVAEGEPTPPALSLS